MNGLCVGATTGTQHRNQANTRSVPVGPAPPSTLRAHSISSQYTQSLLHLLPVHSKLAPSPPSTLKAHSSASQYTQSSLQFIPVHSELTQSRLIYLVFKLESRATENIKLERLDICLNSCSVLNFLIFLGFKSHKLVVP